MDESTLSMREDGGHPVAGVSGTWGPFKLIEKVGQGAFGEVYRAFDSTLEREVALKLLIPRGLDSETEAKALLREARAVARVRHANVVPVYGVDRHDGRVGFWSDFVRGKTLSALLAAHGPFGPRETALIGIDLCKAVSAVHAAGLLHRDIKTGNAMREEGGRILLMDFGLTHDHDAEGAWGGTPTYMAPEIVAGGTATVASDIYALGVLLFHLLTGKYPVEVPSLQALKDAHQSGSRRSLLDLRPDLPEPLARVIEKAIHPDPGKRYASAGQMITALSEGIGLSSISSEAPTAPQTSRLWRWMLVPLAALLLLVIPQVRNVLWPGKLRVAPASGTYDKYQKAHDLLEHYYRPQALETAIPMLEEIVKTDPSFAAGFADLGRAYEMQFTQQRDPQYIDPARNASLRALELQPGLASAHVTLGALYARTSNNDLAAQELNEALRLDKYNATAYGALGDLYNRQGRTAEAELMFQKAVDLAPEDWQLVQQLGEYYLLAGKWEQARGQYQKAADLTPDNPRAFNNLGAVYRNQNKLAESSAAFEKALKLEPTFNRYTNVGMVFEEQGKYPEALGMFEKAIELNPSDYRVWGYVGSVYRHTGVDSAKVQEAYLKAISFAEELKKHTPNDPTLLVKLGLYYAAIGKEAQSVPLLKRGAALAPDKPETLYDVGAAYEMLHLRREALKALEQAIQLGYSPQRIEGVPDFSALRADSRYRAIINTAR